MSDTGKAKGALVNQQELIKLRFPARNMRLGRRPRRMGAQSGAHHSPFRGRGLEFQEVRQYQGGDEIRHIDWRVTARSTHVQTKLFQQEKERPVMICVDQRQSMFFGSKACFKSVLAAHAASLLAWAGLNNNDRVGGLVFNDSDHTEIRPQRNKRAVLHLINTMEDYNHRLQTKTKPNENSLAIALEELRRITRPGTTVFVISDFYQLNEDAAKHLHQLARHNDVIAVVISDPLEHSLPAAGNFTVSNGEDQLALSGGKKLQSAFDEVVNLREQRRGLSFIRSRIHPVALSTPDNFVDKLQRELNL